MEYPLELWQVLGVIEGILGFTSVNHTDANLNRHPLLQKKNIWFIRCGSILPLVWSGIFLYITTHQNKGIKQIICTKGKIELQHIYLVSCFLNKYACFDLIESPWNYGAVLLILNSVLITAVRAFFKFIVFCSASWVIKNSCCRSIFQICCILFCTCWVIKKYSF